MASVAGRLTGAGLTYGLGGIVSRLASLLLLPLFTRFLTTADYGVIAMLAIMTNLLAGAVTLGIGNSLGICFHEARGEEEQSRVVWSAAFVVVASGLAWLVIGLIASPWISTLAFRTTAHSVPVRLAFGQLVASAAVVPLLSRWRMEERARPYVIATAGLTAATGLCNAIAVAWLHLGLLGMLWSTFLVQATFCVAMYVLFWIKDPPDVASQWARRLVRLGWPSILGVGAFFALDFGGRIILERLAGLKSVGVYSVGLSLGLGITILADGAFGVAWPGFFLTFLNRQDEARHVFGKVLYYYLVLFLTLVAAFFVLAKPAVALLTAPAFHAAAQVVGIIALNSVLKGVYLILLPGFYFHRKLQVQTALEWCGASVGLALTLLLVPRFGIVGAALGALGGYSFLCLATVVVARRYLLPRVDGLRLATLVLSFVSVAALSYLDLQVAPIAEWLIRGSVWIGYGLFVWWMFIDSSVGDLKRSLGFA